MKNVCGISENIFLIWGFRAQEPDDSKIAKKDGGLRMLPWGRYELELTPKGWVMVANGDLCAYCRHTARRLRYPDDMKLDETQRAEVRDRRESHFLT